MVAARAGVASTAVAPGEAASYSSKPAAYFAGARDDFIAALPDDRNASVLEIGCGSGATGALALACGKAGRYVGVELFPSAAEAARRELSEVVIGDIERLEPTWAPESFDALILSEVLEHLVDPWRVVRKLAPLVRPGGMVLASSPNVAHWRVIRELAAGRFVLADQGVFDRTHMRWFTPSTFRSMFEAGGFGVDRVGPVTPYSARTRLISRVTRGALDHLFMTQISLRGHRL